MEKRSRSKSILLWAHLGRAIVHVVRTMEEAYGLLGVSFPQFSCISEDSTTQLPSPRFQSAIQGAPSFDAWEGGRGLAAHGCEMRLDHIVVTE